MKYNEFKEATALLVCPDQEYMTPEEWKTLNRQIATFTTLAIDNMAREIYPLEKTAAVIGKDDVPLPEDALEYLGTVGEAAHLRYDHNGAPVLSFDRDGEHTVRYTFSPGAVTGDDFDMRFPTECCTAMMYFVAYHIFSLSNDTREYSTFYNLYNQACSNIIASRKNRVCIIGGDVGV